MITLPGNYNYWLGTRAASPQTTVSLNYVRGPNGIGNIPTIYTFLVGGKPRAINALRTIWNYNPLSGG